LVCWLAYALLHCHAEHAKGKERQGKDKKVGEGSGEAMATGKDDKGNAKRA
jgi:hypothetical protein